MPTGIYIVADTVAIFHAVSTLIGASSSIGGEPVDITRLIYYIKIGGRAGELAPPKL